MAISIHRSTSLPMVGSLRCNKPPLVAPFGAAETGRRDGRGTQEAHARLHSAGSLNRSHCCAAGGGGSFAAPTGHALSDELPFSGYTALKYFIKPDSLTY